MVVAAQRTKQENLVRTVPVAVEKEEVVAMMVVVVEEEEMVGVTVEEEMAGVTVGLSHQWDHTPRSSQSRTKKFE